MSDCQPPEKERGWRDKGRVNEKEREWEKGREAVKRKRGVSDAPLAKCCGSRHGTANLLFCSPLSLSFLSRVRVLSRHIIGSAWFVFHWRALSKVQTVIYLVSPIPCLARPSCQLPPNMWDISSVTGVLRQSPLSRSPRGPGETREERRKEYNRLSLLYSGTSTLIRHQRTEAPMTFQMTTQGPQRAGVDFFSNRLLVSAGSFLALSYSVQYPPQQRVAHFDFKSHEIRGGLDHLRSSKTQAYICSIFLPRLIFMDASSW